MWLDAYADGALEAERAIELEAHLDACAACREALEEIRDVKRLVGALAAPPAARAEADLTIQLEDMLARLRDEPFPAAEQPDAAFGDRAAGAAAADDDAHDAGGGGVLRGPGGSMSWLAAPMRAAAALVLAVGLGIVVTARLPSGVSIAWAPGAFARFEHTEVPFQAKTSPLPVADASLSNVRGAAALELGDAVQRALRERGQAAIRGRALAASEVYEEAVARGEAPFWTADLAGAALFRTLADVRQQLYAEVVAPELDALLAGLETQLARTRAAHPEPALREAASLSLAIVQAGGKLLRGTASQDAVDERVGGELARVERAAGIETSLLTGARTDYAAIPPEDGTARRRLERALRWLGTGMLPLDQAEGARAALVLVHALLSAEHGQALARYERVRGVLDFLEGEPDGWTPARLVPWLRGQVGSSLSLDDLAVGPRADRLLGALGNVPGPRIPGPEGERPMASLLGQRYGLEAEAAARLSWPRAGTSESPRLDPGGLDVLAALRVRGAQEALAKKGTLTVSGFSRELTALSEELAPVRERRGRAGGEDLTWLLAYAVDGLAPQGSGRGYPETARAGHRRRAGGLRQAAARGHAGWRAGADGQRGG
jgi:anti-sigma factor RsiW